MPRLHILQEALTSYMLLVRKKINILENSTTDVQLNLAHLNFTYDKIDLLNHDIETSNNTSIDIKVCELKKYFKDYDIGCEDIKEIKKLLRRINNRHYARTSRDKRKKAISEDNDSEDNDSEDNDSD